MPAALLPRPGTMYPYGRVHPEGVTARVEALRQRSIKKESKIWALRTAISMCDLTTLEGADTAGKVQALCSKARNPSNLVHDCPQVAAVCVYPTLVAVAKSALAKSDVRVASVATGFPSGQFPLSVRLADVERAVRAGADEIDMVINRGAFLSGNFRLVFREITRVKAACGDAVLKVILETGELGCYDAIRNASFIAMHAGADFIKTSTGKISPAATRPVTLVMLEAIRDYFEMTKRRVGMKPAGGIRTAKEAIQYLVLLNETLGDDWLTPNLFRFGASALLNDLLSQLVKQESGVYRSPDEFSLD